MQDDGLRRLLMTAIPQRFLAAQLRRPSGRFGRWVMTRGLNDGNAELIDATVDALALGPGERFLDVGFGGGRSLRRAAAQGAGALWGVDFAPDMVREGHRYFAELVSGGRLNLLTADVSALPLRDHLVDAICTTNTVYFWPDLPGALSELARVLAPGGRIAFGYTGRAKMERFSSVTQHGFRTFVPSELEAELRAAGYVEVKSTDLAGKATDGDHVTYARRG